MNLIECKVTFDQQQDSGVVRRVSEIYLLDALSFSEAEARVMERNAPFTGSFNYMKVVSFGEAMVDKDADFYFVAKLNFVTVDENTGYEKKLSHKVLISADDIDEAKQKADELISQSLGNLVLVEIKASRVVDFIMYEPEVIQDEVN